MNTTFLSQTRLFQNMSSEEIDHCLLALRARTRAYRKDEYIFHAGSTTSEMAVLEEGTAAIESNDIWGNCTVLNLVKRGGFFAETYAMNENEIMSVDVKATTDTTIVFLDLAPIRNLSCSNTTWITKFLANLLMISTQKNLHLSARSFHTAPKTIRAKVLTYLNSVAIKKGMSEFDIPFNRQQLADYLNIDRTNLSKELSAMKAEGLIDCRKNHFQLFTSSF